MMNDFDVLMDEKPVIKDMHTMSLSACLNRIMLKVQSDDYSESLVEAMKKDFDYVEKKMGICAEEAVILSCVLEKATGGFYSCHDRDISSFMGCTNIEFMKYRKHLDTLAKKRIVRTVNRRGDDVVYKVQSEAYDAIREDAEFSKRSFSGINTEEMFSQMRKLFRSFRNEEIDEEMLLDDLNMLAEVNQQNVFSQKVVAYNIDKMDPTEQRVFYYLCHRYVSFGDKQVDFFNIKDFISYEDDEQKFLRHFQAGRTKLQVDGLICFGGEENFVDKNQACLTDKVINEFFTELDVFSESRTDGHRDLMSCDKIVAKELFYNASEQEKVSRLESLLESEHFKGIQNRLEEMGMRKGFNIIFYGGPGTGKTETVMQLAKKTGRDILYIDMSKIKSKWVGDSEKAIKGVFTTYKRLCKGKSIKPILFFNEADAIFGKRMENVDSSADQMLNSMQNIILQEMESIEGIMICTTNLHSNLDPAFERRFLYKVELKNPDDEVRAKIWKSMMKGMNDEDYATLAQRYSFSGGQIENVVRKSTVDYILSGDKTSLETICKFCDEEMFKSKVNRIGF